MLIVMSSFRVIWSIISLSNYKNINDLLSKYQFTEICNPEFSKYPYFRHPFLLTINSYIYDNIIFNI